MPDHSQCRLYPDFQKVSRTALHSNSDGEGQDGLGNVDLCLQLCE